MAVLILLRFSRVVNICVSYCCTVCVRFLPLTASKRCVEFLVIVASLQRSLCKFHPVGRWFRLVWSSHARSSPESSIVFPWKELGTGTVAFSCLLGPFFLEEWHRPNLLGLLQMCLNTRLSIHYALSMSWTVLGLLGPVCFVQDGALCSSEHQF